MKRSLKILQAGETQLLILCLKTFYAVLVVQYTWYYKQPMKHEYFMNTQYKRNQVLVTFVSITERIVMIDFAVSKHLIAFSASSINISNGAEN